MTFDWSRVGEQPTPIDALAGMPVTELLPPEDALRAAKPYDMAPIRAKLSPYEAELGRMREQAKAIEVSDDASAEKATALGVQCQKIEKAVEEARTFYKRPALDFGREIDNFARAYLSKAGEAKSILSRKVSAYQNKKKMEELDRLRKEQEEAAKLQAKLDAEAKHAGTDAVQVVMPKSLP